MNVVRCGLDLDHEEHEHPLGHCDGKALDLPELQPGDPVDKLFTRAGVPLAWSWSTLTLTQARELRELLDKFVARYNATWAVLTSELIPACWPLHPGLADELAVLHAVHVHLFESALAPATDAAGWFSRTLPEFQERLPRWLGDSASRCNPTVGHRPDWAPAARQLPADHTGMDRNELAEAVDDALLSYTRP